MFLSILKSFNIPKDLQELRFYLLRMSDEVDTSIATLVACISFISFAISYYFAKESHYLLMFLFMQIIICIGVYSTIFKKDTFLENTELAQELTTQFQDIHSPPLIKGFVFYFHKQNKFLILFIDQHNVFHIVNEKGLKVKDTFILVNKLKELSTTDSFILQEEKITVTQEVFSNERIAQFNTLFSNQNKSVKQQIESNKVASFKQLTDSNTYFIQSNDEAVNTLIAQIKAELLSALDIKSINELIVAYDSITEIGQQLTVFNEIRKVIELIKDKQQSGGVIQENIQYFKEKYQ